MESYATGAANPRAAKPGTETGDQQDPSSRGGSGRRTYRVLLLLTLLLVCTRLGYSLAEFLLPLALGLPETIWPQLIAVCLAFLLLRQCTENFLAESRKLHRKLELPDTHVFLRAVVIILVRHGAAWVALVACISTVILV